MLLTKLHIPQAKENVIHRYILFDKLNFIVGRKLILVSAPAGYGKTTLLCDWLKKSKMPTAWFSIDHRDNDVLEFVNIIINGIQSIHKDIGNQSLELLKSKVTVSIEYIIELLINDILAIKSDFLLVLDDLHSISSKEIYSILSILITQSPGNFKIAILTRSDPPINLSRLRSQNELIEIRSSDLSFTTSDISELFNKNLKLGLNTEDIDVIKAKTEGWIAGLQLAAFSLKGKENVTEFINGIAGYNRYIMDYLMEEVLSVQNKEIKEFLLNTSIFEKLSGELCDFVLQKSNSQFILESLERNNLFVVSLDNERKWFRYHHLFRDLLEQRFITANKELNPIFHNRASSWFESKDIPRMAIEHSLQAGNTKKGVELINSIIDYLVETAQYPLILRYAELFSENDIISNINFGIYYAWSLTITGRLNEAEKYLFELEEKNDKEDFKNESAGLLGRMYTTYSMLNDFLGDDASALKYAELAIKHTPKENLVWNSWAYYCKGGPHLLRFEIDESISSLSKGLELAKKSNNIYLEIVHIKIIYLLKVKGSYSEALKACKDILKKFDVNHSTQGFKVNLFISAAYSTIGSVLIEQGITEDGIKMALKGFELSQKLASMTFRGYSRLLLAEVYFKAGEHKKALSIIDKLDGNLKDNQGHWLSVLANALKLKLLSHLGLKEEAALFYNHVIKPAKHHRLEYYVYRIATIHFFISTGRYDEANILVEELLPELEKKNIVDLFVEVKIMQIKILFLTNRKEGAIDNLLNLLILTEKENYINAYINAGDNIAGLLKEISTNKLTRSSRKLSQISNQYLHKLNAAFELLKKREKNKAKSDLSEREIETLALLAQDKSNQQIADKLFISLNTVKTRLKNIFLKLDVDNRRKAVDKAKSEGLI